MYGDALSQAMKAMIAFVAVITVLVTLAIVFGGGWIIQHVRVVVQ